jgi:hypothetical protein
LHVADPPPPAAGALVTLEPPAFEPPETDVEAGDEQPGAIACVTQTPIATTRSQTRRTRDLASG